MVDRSKRHSLKSIGALMAVPIVPAVAIPTTAQAKTTDVRMPLNKDVANEELSIVLLLSDKPMMRVTNNSRSLSILRRIHPGVVHAGTKTYDLNHALLSSSYAIGALSSRLIPITEASSSNSANDAKYTSNSRKPLRLATISVDNMDGRVSSLSHAFFTHAFFT